MTDAPTEHRFYGDLAAHWVRRRRWLLLVSRRLNPECEHSQGDAAALPSGWQVGDGPASPRSAPGAGIRAFRARAHGVCEMGILRSGVSPVIQ